MPYKQKKGLKNISKQLDNHLEKNIIRRKSKRIERASEEVMYLKSEIKNSNKKEMSAEWRDYLLKNMERLELYLVNDDLVENQFNYDNKN